MDSDIQEVIYCEDDGKYRVYCNICDELSIKRYFKNRSKSQIILIMFIKDNN